jgi:hypothetical protein
MDPTMGKERAAVGNKGSRKRERTRDICGSA